MNCNESCINEFIKALFSHTKISPREFMECMTDPECRNTLTSVIKQVQDNYFRPKKLKNNRVPPSLTHTRQKIVLWRHNTWKIWHNFRRKGKTTLSSTCPVSVTFLPNQSIVNFLFSTVHWETEGAEYIPWFEICDGGISFAVVKGNVPKRTL